MSKKYQIFSELPEGYFKPSGTLGDHHCTVVCQGDEKVVVGSVAGKVTLKPGDTLGYNCGRIWVVPRPESYKDPIRRVLAQAHLSQRLLTYSTDSVEYTLSWQDTRGWPSNSGADPSTGEEAVIFGSYDRETLDSWDGGRCRRITGGDAIVIRTVVGHETTDYRPRKVTRIVIRPTADKEFVTNWLFEQLIPDGIARRRERESQERFLAKFKELISSQGMEISSDEELTRIGEFYKAVSEARYRQKEMSFQGTEHQLSWHSRSSGMDEFFWKSASSRIELASAVRSGLLEAWATAATATVD